MDTATTSPDIVVDLLSPFAGPDGTVTRIGLREPTLKEFITIGEPYTFIPEVNGVEVPVENDDVIAKYLFTLVVEPNIPSLLNKVKISDTMRIKEALLSFFMESRERAFRTPLNSTSSGSTSSAPSSSTP